jgi:peptide/nickel transport system substrate-binding protein
MHRRTLLQGAASLGAALAAPALAAGTQSHTLRFRPQADVTALDPLSTTSYSVRNHGHMCWDTLYGLDTAFQPQPQLAEGSTVEQDGKLWTFTLRQGPTFQDGTPVRAADAVASIKRWMVKDTHGQTLAARMAEIRAIDDRRFAIRLNKPFGVMLAALGKSSSYPCFIMPERFAGTPATTPLTEVVGSGPYRFAADEWRSGALAVYRKFDAYIPTPVGQPSMTAGPKLAWFDRVEWQWSPDPATAAAALQRGELDWLERPSIDLLPLLKRDKSLVLDLVETNGSFVMLRPNHITEPFSDPAARRAILPALAQIDFMSSISSDPSLYKVGVGCFPAGSPLASDEDMAVLTSPRSLDRTRDLLKQAGKAGARTVVLNPGDQQTNNALTLVAEDLFQKAGLHVEDATSDWGTVLQRRAKKEPLDQGGWSALIVLFGGEDMANPGGNPLLRGNGADAWFGWPTSPVIESLRDQWFDAATPADQAAIGRKIQAQFFIDVPYWPVGQYYLPTAYRTGLTDIRRGMCLPLNVRWSA